MDDLAGLVEYVRRNYVDHKRDLWKDAANGLAYYYKSLPEGARPARLGELIDRSGSAKLAWNAVSLIAQDALRSGEPLPPHLAEWTADVLAGARPRPTKGAQTTQERQVRMYLAVYDLRQRFGLRPTRNETSPPRSGCDVVAEAWGVNYKTVEGAWAERDPILAS